MKLKKISKLVAILLLTLPLAMAQQTRVFGDGGNWTQEIAGSLAAVKNLRVKVDVGSVKVDGGSQPVGVVGNGRIDAVGPGLLLVFARPPYESDDGFDGESRRHFTGGVTPHAVGDDEQPEIFVDEDRIFVRAPYRAAIGAPSSAYRRHDRFSPGPAIL